MASFSLQEILEATGGEADKNTDLVFTGISTDTRKIQKGDLFVALKGENFNGEDFVKGAFSAGALGAVVSEGFPGEASGLLVRVKDTLKAYQDMAAFHRRRFAIPVVAITGSNGKTTTKDLTAAVLSAKGEVLKTQGNFNNEVGLPLTLLGLEERHSYAVVEIGMRGLHQIEKLAPIATPNVAVVTNVGESHMEILGSVENIAKAKGELVEAIGAGGICILNADDGHVAQMASLAGPGVRVLTYGLGKRAKVRGEAVRREGNVTKFMVLYGNERHDYAIPMVGRHNVMNALAAVAVGFSLGLTPGEIAGGLRRLEGTKMRFETEDAGGVKIVNDAYNASPLSMNAALDTLKDIAPARKIGVLGDMLELGQNTQKLHREVGEKAAKCLDILITLGELGREIAAGAKTAGLKAVYSVASHEEAKEMLERILKKNDTVLFKGSRGMGMEEIIRLWKEAGSRRGD